MYLKKEEDEEDKGEDDEELTKLLAFINFFCDFVIVITKFHDMEYLTIHNFSISIPKFIISDRNFANNKLHHY